MRRSGTQHHYWKGGNATIACPICGQSFEVKPYRLRRTPDLCCSPSCAGKQKVAKTFGNAGKRDKSGDKNPNWRGGRVLVLCDTCQKPLRRKPFAVGRSNRPFCSQVCWGKWASKNRIGAAHPGWKGGHIEYYGPNWCEQKRAARKRDGYKCRACGKPQKQNGRALDVHHINPFRTFGYIPNQNDYYLLANALTNLLSLCRRCHKLAEHGSIAIQPFLL